MHAWISPNVAPEKDYFLLWLQIKGRTLLYLGCQVLSLHQWGRKGDFLGVGKSAVMCWHHRWGTLCSNVLLLGQNCRIKLSSNHKDLPKNCHLTTLPTCWRHFHLTSMHCFWEWDFPPPPGWLVVGSSLENQQTPHPWLWNGISILYTWSSITNHLLIGGSCSL